MPSKTELLMGFLQGGMKQGAESADEQSKDNRHLALQQYLMGEKDRQQQAGEQRRSTEFQGLLKQNPKTSVSLDGMKVDPEPSVNLKALLTPAQESAEKAVGKQIADFDAAGGRPAMEKNLNSLKEVQNEIPNRGVYDRLTGAALGSFPGALGLVNSDEKARRDKARNTANMIAKASDPNPTEKQVEMIMGQIYDPASSNEDNAARISRFLEEQQRKSGQMESASQRYKQTGYATMGNGPTAAPAASSGDTGQAIQRLQELRAKYKR